MKQVFSFLFVCLTSLMLVISCGTNGNEGGAEPLANLEEQSGVLLYGIDTSGMELKKYVVGRGDFFGDIMFGLGVTGNGLQRVINSADTLFDIRKIKVGNGYEVLFNKEGEALYLLYHRDAVSSVLFSLKDSIYTRIVEKEIVRKTRYAEVSINSSLWNDVAKAGASPLLALELSDVYAWTIDFFGLQRGDSFRVVYEEILCEGEFVDIGKIIYCEFVHNGKPYVAVNFVDGEKGNEYWNEEGESLKKAFLKAPLQFKRISSKFTYKRFHPVYKRYRAHTGVDYAAPAGTPVMSIGDGVVLSMGWAGDGGKTVKIRHNSVYTTAYLHLSRYAKGLKSGDRVKQGEVIGYVGSTGASTGPHLDFRVWKNGTPVDPLKLESPSVEPVSKENMEAFRQQHGRSKWQMDSLSTVTLVDKLIGIL